MKTTEMDFLIVLELEVLNCQGPALSEGPGFSPLSCFRLLLALAGIPWHVDASRQSLPPWSHGVLFVCSVSVSKCQSSLKDSSHGTRPALIQDDFTLT